MTLSEALKSNAKVDKFFHVSQNCHIVRFVYQLSHNTQASIDTYAHEQLYSAHTEVNRPVVKHFQYQYHCWHQEDNVR